MTKEVFIIWNWKEKRPAVMQSNYAPMLVFHTLDHAQAHEAGQKEINKINDLEIRKAVITIEDSPII
jgi:hypothetical protein